MTELLPCPFCGGKADARISSQINEELMLVNVGCPVCDIRTSFITDDRLQEAIAAWNTRTFKAVYEDGNLCRIVTDTDTFKPERTCNAESNGTEPICSECGCWLPVYITDCNGRQNTRFNYCPNCGAKVE